MHRLNQLREMHRSLCNVAGAALVLCTLGPSLNAAQPPELFLLEEIEAGQRGYGLSVFSGAVIERFEVEVLGVWENLQPNNSYVLARLEGHGLEKSGVIAGMSGSPVYLDGRLLGAVSFGWPFSNEAIAGITPAENMRPMLSAELAPETVSGSAVGPSAQKLLAGAASEDDLRRALSVLRPKRLGEAPAALEWATVGFGKSVGALLAEELGPVAAAGSLGAAARGVRPGDLEPGSAVAAVLVDGDLRLAATGTVTDRSGDSVLAFGHPFLGLGALEVPMATAEVLTVVSSQWTSFKVANLGPVVGAVDFDFLTGIRGTLGREAPVVPMVLRLAGEEPVRLSLARIPQLTSALAAISVLGALGAEAESAGAKSVDLALSLDLGSHGSLALEQSFDGQGAALAAALHVFAVTGYLLQNRLGEVEVEGIEVDLTTHSRPRTLALVGAHPSRSVVRPGESITLNVDLAAYRGAKRRVELDVAVPSDLTGKTYTLLVGDGYTIDALRLSLEQSEPRTLRQALSFLDSLHSRRELRVLGVVDGAGLAVAGEVLPELPGSMRSLWSASGGGGAQTLRMAVAEEAGKLLEEPTEGLLRIDLEVQRGKPLRSLDGQSGAEGGSGPEEVTREEKKP